MCRLNPPDLYNLSGCKVNQFQFSMVYGNINTFVKAFQINQKMTDPISITPLTCEILEPLALNPLETHRHDHEELWIVTHGNPVHSVDFSSETLESPVIVYVAQIGRASCRERVYI